MFNMLVYILLIICVLLCVAFITLLERKILGYIQIRKGPNKVGYIGLLQPFSDAIKLFLKENISLLMFNLYYYYLAPVLGLFLMLMFWLIVPWKNEMISNFDIIYIFCISSLGLYVILLAGWSSNSKYSLIGSYRGVAQTISYEVSLCFMVLSLVLLIGEYSLVKFVSFQNLWWMLMGNFLVFGCWLVTILAETNRTPFDFSEGESELVSGFNVEYGGGGFAVLFMSEYGNIIFMSLLTSLMFFGTWIFIFLGMMLVMIFYLWVRGSFPRFRYDNLMMLAWKVLLPFSLTYFFFISCMVMNFN